MDHTDDIQELSEYLSIDMDMTCDELQHFDLPKFKLPKIDLPKIDLPKIELPFGKKKSSKDKKKDKSKDKKKDDKKKDKKNKSDEPKDKESGRYGREWKDHKWVDRKRDENGKWIYDYGDGFPDEVSGKRGLTAEQANQPYALDNKQISKLQKVSGLLSDIGRMLISPDMEDKINAGKDLLGRMDEVGRTAISELKKFGKKTDEKSGLRMKDPNNKDTIMDDLDSVNPGWNNKDNGSQYNCNNCTIAFDMRQRGYEVTAAEDINGSNYRTMQDMYQGGNMQMFTADYYGQTTTEAVYDGMKSEPEGSSGMMVMQWYPAGSGGHVVNYKIENGEPIIYDSQTHERKPASEYTNIACEFGYMRTDNLEPNWDLVRTAVE